MQIKDFSHRHLWIKRGITFAVEVSRYDTFPDPGPYKWAVYAYIYPRHPHFSQFEGDSIFQDAASVMPLHRYCSLLWYYRVNSEEVNSIKVGADYNHFGDDFTFEETPPQKVVDDANILYRWLKDIEDNPFPESGGE